MTNPLNVTSHYYKTAYRHDEPAERDPSSEVGVERAWCNVCRLVTGFVFTPGLQEPSKINNCIFNKLNTLVY